MPAIIVPLLIGGAVLTVIAVAIGFGALPWSMALMALVGLTVWSVGGVVRGVVETFVSAMWTLAYREMHGLGPTGEPAQ